MAIYEYYCPSCKKKFEQRRPMSEVAVATRCECGADADRMISAFALTRSEAGAFDMEAMSDGGGGGCCGGGGCACSGAN